LVLNKAVGCASIPILLEQLPGISDPHSRLSILKILRAIYMNVPDRQEVWAKYNLGPIIQTLAKDPIIIVNQMAFQMIHDNDNLNK